MRAVIKSIIQILAVLGISIATPLHAEEIDIFGPQTFSKVKGKPKTETVNFNVPIDIEGTLIILNGGEANAPRKKRVSKGKVVLNGEKIIPQKIFIDHDKDKDKDKDKDRDRRHRHKRHNHKKKIKLNKRVGQIILPVSLQAGNNTLSIKLKGRRGSKISAHIVFDDQPPTAAFTVNPQTGDAPLTVTFDASASTDPNDSIASYDWTFGDGATATGVTQAHTFATPGTFTVTLTVTDQFGLTNQATTSITVNDPNLPPVAAFTATPTEGDNPLTVAFDGSGSTDPNDSIASYSWNFGEPGAPAGSGVTTSHTYTNDGTFTATLTVTDSFGLTDQVSTTITVFDLPDGTASLSGRLLDTNDFVADGTETPVVGATVSLLNTTFITTTDANGEFRFIGAPAEAHILDINTTTANPAPDGSIYAGFREQITVLEGVNTVLRPFFMPRIDASSLTTVVPDEVTMVENPNLNIMLEVPAFSAKNEDGSDFTGQLSISEVPDGLAPAALPEELDPGLLITIQPVGVTFSTPAPISFPNTDNLPPGAEADIWSLDPDAGQFIIVGVGVVSPDGSTVDTVSGGIIAADWHAILPPQTDTASATNETNKDQSKETDCACGSSNGLKSGELKEDHTLAGYRSFGQQRALTFSYRSLSADPRPIVATTTTIPVRSTVPLSLSASLEIEGQQVGQEVFTATTGLSENFDESVRQMVQFDASHLESGIYPYRMKITSNFVSSRRSTFQNGNVLVNNQSASPFGAGWSLDGLSRLKVDADGNPIIIEGDGSIKSFTRRLQPGEVFFSSTFEGSVEPQWSLTNLDVTPTGSRGFLGQFTNNNPTLTLNDLPTHTGIQVDFELFIIRTWDGNVGPDDIWSLKEVGGQTLLETTFSNGNPGTLDFPQSYPDPRGAADNPARTGGTGFETLGFGQETIYNLSFNFGHTASSLGLEFRGRQLQQITDESWGLDNVVIRLFGTEAGDPTVFNSPEGDFTVLKINPDNTFTRRLKDGTKIEFDANGLQTAVTDRNGNSTLFAYDTNVACPIKLYHSLS